MEGVRSGSGIRLGSDSRIHVQEARARSWCTCEYLTTSTLRTKSGTRTRHSSVNL
jgi:hypothetical protein